MRVVVNGEPRELDEGLTVRQLLDRLGVGVGPVVVERNGKVMRRDEHVATALGDGDVVEIAAFAEGG